MNQVANLNSVPEHHREVVAMCRNLGLTIIDTNLNGWQVLAGGSGFNLEFSIVHDDPRRDENGVSVIVRFPCLAVGPTVQSARNASGRMLVTVEEFAGLTPGPHAYQELPILQQRLGRLIPALTQKLIALHQDPDLIRRELRSILDKNS